MDASVSHERAEQIRRLFDELVEAGPEERVRRLGEVEDAALRREVEALLRAFDRADDVLRGLDEPTVAQAAGDAFAGTEVSHYHVLERLGGGGMGVVYKARDTKLDRTVALKFLPPYLSTDADAKARFIHEAKAASALDHPHIGTIYEIDETADGRLFIAMAYYPGETLKQKVARGPVPAAEAQGYAEQMAEGLAAAHAAGIVHRDVKPANVLVTERGRVKVVDFGLAKVAGTELTRGGAALGTVAYMSPEQTRGEAVDARTDLWSLGVVLYELLTGARPFGGENDRTLIHAIRHDAPVPVAQHGVELPPGLEAMVQRCLAKDPGERYQTAQEVLADLQAEREGGDIVRRRTSRGRRAVTFGVAALVLMLAVVLGSAWLNGRAATDVIDSIAVLPLANLSGDPARAYFADGMTEELIAALGQIEALRVISRTSAMRYKETTKPLPQIAEELGVKAIVEGSVTQEGDEVRIQVRLIDGETEKRLWARRFAQPARNVLALQHEIARAIAREIEVSVTAADEARLSRTPEVDPEAYDQYLKGVEILEGRGDVAERQALSYLEASVAADPRFAPAYAQLAIAYILNEQNATKASRAVEQALRLDPGLSTAYVARGLGRQLYDWDWQGAERALRRAIALDPNNAEAHHELAILLSRLGRFDQAIEAERRALLLDPLSAMYRSGLGEIYLVSRRYERAIVELQKALDLEPGRNQAYLFLSYAYGFSGKYEEALQAWSKTGNSWPKAHLYALMGLREEARDKVDTIGVYSALHGQPPTSRCGLASTPCVGSRASRRCWSGSVWRAMSKQPGISVRPDMPGRTGMSLCCR